MISLTFRGIIYVSLLRAQLLEASCVCKPIRTKDMKNIVLKIEFDRHISLNNLPYNLPLAKVMLIYVPQFFNDEAVNFSSYLIAYRMVIITDSNITIKEKYE